MIHRYYTSAKNPRRTKGILMVGKKENVAVILLFLKTNKQTNKQTNVWI